MYWILCYYIRRNNSWKLALDKTSCGNGWSHLFPVGISLVHATTNLSSIRHPTHRFLVHQHRFFSIENGIAHNDLSCSSTSPARAEETDFGDGWCWFCGIAPGGSVDVDGA